MRISSLIFTALASLCAVAAPFPVDDQVRNIAGAIGNATHSSALLARSPASAPVKAATPPVPSIEEIKKHMHSQAEMVGKSLFYSGPGGYGKKAIELAKKIDRKTIDEFWLPSESTYSKEWQDKGDHIKNKFWDNASAAMAQLSSGVVYVLLPSHPAGTPGDEWFKGAVWARIEWPNLSGGHNPKTRLKGLKVKLQRSF